MLAAAFITASAAILFLLGAVHLAFTFFGDKLRPRDAALQLAMAAGSPGLTRQTSMWHAWIGFNASHSLGAMLFGAMYAFLALVHPALLLHSVFLGLLGLLTLLSYLILARRYWFARPLQGIALALLCYVLGFALA